MDEDEDEDEAEDGDSRLRLEGGLDSEREDRLRFLGEPSSSTPSSVLESESRSLSLGSYSVSDEDDCSSGLGTRNRLCLARVVISTTGLWRRDWEVWRAPERIVELRFATVGDGECDARGETLRSETGEGSRRSTWWLCGVGGGLNSDGSDDIPLQVREGGTEITGAVDSGSSWGLFGGEIESASGVP